MAPGRDSQTLLLRLYTIDLVNFIIQIDSQSDTICSFLGSSSTTYNTESSDFSHYEIHSII